MLQPKKTKFRKAFKGRIRGVAKGGFELNLAADPLVGELAPVPETGS